jgi:type III secretion protein T
MAIPDGIIGAITPLLQMKGALGDVLENIGLCSLRFYTAFSLLPATGDQFIQGLIRASFVVMLGFFVAFGMPTGLTAEFKGVMWLALGIKEALIGLLMGFAAATVFWIAESVGAMLDTQTGYNNVQLSNPMSGQQSTPISGMLLQMMVAVFYVLGGMVVFLGVLFESFKIWPVTKMMPITRNLSEVFVLQQTDFMMTAVVKFSAPVLLILVLIDLGFGLITRAADKLEPSGLSQPVKGAVGVLLLSLLVGLFTEQVRSYLLPTDLITRMQALMPAVAP